MEAGDGTTSVVVTAGSLLEAAERLLQKGIHPTLISDAFQKAAFKSVSILMNMSIPVDLTDKESLVKVAATSLNSKVYPNFTHITILLLSFYSCSVNVQFYYYIIPGCTSAI